jgi:hypothetical protein
MGYIIFISVDINLINHEVKNKVVLVHSMAGVVSVSPASLYLNRMGPQCTRDRRMGELQSWLEHSGEEKNVLWPPGF